MKFEKQGSLYIATGEKGCFYIKKSRGWFWAEYVGKCRAFKFPPCQFIKEAKELCRGNAYWEEECVVKVARFTPARTKDLPFEEMKQMNFLKEKYE